MQSSSAFDALYISSKLTDTNGKFMRSELHLFAYLACLLFLYEGHAVSDWTYSFVGTDLGTPFSASLEQSIEDLLRSSMLRRSNDSIEISEGGCKALNEFSSLRIFEDRVSVLEASTASATYYSTGIVREALMLEPDLKRVKTVGGTRNLLESGSTDPLYEQFGVLKSALPDSKDLRVPSLVWVSALFSASTEGTFE